VPSAEWRLGSMSEVVDELRRHICGACLRGENFEGDDPVDIEFEGRTIECRDADELLSTCCGLEYSLEEEPV
jgi:hypothetical protein